MERDTPSARLAVLSPEKRALLERRLRNEPPPPQISGYHSDKALASLSFLRVLLPLSAPLNHEALARSFQEVVRRHEILRTAFREIAGGCAQLVLAGVEVAILRIDLTALPSDLREEESLRCTRELAFSNFDLAQPPLMRVVLIAHGSENRLLVAVHPMVSGLLSIGVLMSEVGALYAEAVAGQARDFRPTGNGILPQGFDRRAAIHTLYDDIDSVYDEMYALVERHQGQSGLREALLPFREKLRVLQEREAWEISERYDSHFRPDYEEAQDLLAKARQMLGLR